MTKELDGREEELHCIECDGVRNIELCKECRDVVCKGCMFSLWIAFIYILIYYIKIAI